MRCQGEGCQKEAVAHITEIADGAASELHLCGQHIDEFVAQNGQLRDQLRQARAAQGGG